MIYSKYLQKNKISFWKKLYLKIRYRNSKYIAFDYASKNDKDYSAYITYYIDKNYNIYITDIKRIK